MRPTQSECAKGADSIAKGKSRKTALQREAQLDATVLEGNFQKHGQVNLSDAFSHFGYPIQRKMSIGDSNIEMEAAHSLSK